MRKYARFFAMITVGTVVMFGVMYLNVYTIGHAHFSQTRLFMALLGGAAMAVVMPGFMLHMFDRRRVNGGIVVASALVFVAALWLVRSQRTVDDESWMKAMIPHHSIAILTSERAQIRDPRVRELADQISETQRREIARMEDLLRELQNRTAAN